MVNQELMAKVQRCMITNEHLLPALFDDSHQLRASVKPALFAVGQLLVDYVKDRVAGIIIEDVLLQGSSASYVYNINSDIDIQARCTHPTIASANLQRILDSIVAEMVFMGYNFTVADKIVDYGLFCCPTTTTGVYSLVQDKWVSTPQKNSFNFSADDLYNLVYEQSLKAEEFTRDILSPKPNLDELRQLREYYNNIKVEACQKAINGEKEYDINYCALKVLRRSGEYANFRKYIIDMHNSILSI